MSRVELERLHEAVLSLKQRGLLEPVVARLRSDLAATSDSFVWTTLDLAEIDPPLPEKFPSGWVFLLRAGVSSGRHYHPNSVQHMIALNGRGRSDVGGVERALVPLGSAPTSFEDEWHVIPEGVPHEFFPEGEDMAVVSFHTCEAAELEEVDCASGGSRLYESPS